MLSEGSVGKHEVVDDTEPANLLSDEGDYLAAFGDKYDGLPQRYDDPASSQQQLKEDTLQYASPVDSEDSKKLGRIEEALGNFEFNSESRKHIQFAAQYEIDRLLKADTSKESGRNNPEKHQILSDHTKRFLDVILLAQEEGDIAKDLPASEVLKLVRDNIYTLVYQDYVASSNNLGDHGMRHLVAHNIHILEQTLAQAKANGQEVRAIDILAGHQIMIDHDAGYAMKPVRDEVDKGNLSADRGHNVLAAKAFRERTEEGTDAASKVFGADMIATIHQGILHHDSADISFVIDAENSDPKQKRENRVKNLLSAVHLADNTHAFEDKLPEILYGYPDSLITMRYLKIASEIGDDSLIAELKNKLKQDIQANEKLAADDKKALSLAVDGMAANGYKFTVGRICGNKPTISMDANGRVTVAVTESAIHQEVVQQFSQASYDQLAKFVADLTGETKQAIVDRMRAGETSFVNGSVIIELKLGANKAEKRSDYEARIAELITQPRVVADMNKDAILAARQRALQENLLANAFGFESYQRVSTDKALDELKYERKILVKNFLKKV